MKIVNAIATSDNIPTLKMEHESTTIFVRPDKNGSFNVYTPYEIRNHVYTRHSIEDMNVFKNKHSKEMLMHLLAETAIAAVIKYCDGEDVCPPKGLHLSWRDGIFKTYIERCYKYIFNEDAPSVFNE